MDRAVRAYVTTSGRTTAWWIRSGGSLRSFILLRKDTRAYDVVCVSPRNHMVFTPLLASTCVGTLEFRSVVEPVSRIQSALATRPGSYFYLANCSGIDTRKHEVPSELTTFPLTLTPTLP
jgi:NADH dehydrogenase FAD-containing subunit